MAKYLMEFKNTLVYEIEVEAESQDEAYEKTKEWGTDDLLDFETINQWDIEVYEID